MDFPSWSDPDEVLVLRALRGDQRGFDGLVIRYRSAARLTAQRILPVREDVEDVVQEAFIRAFGALPHLRDPRHFAFWLRCIVRNLAHRRREQSSARRGDLPLESLSNLPAGDPLPHTQVERREEAGALYRGIARLPEEYAAPLVLYYFRGMRLHALIKALAEEVDDMEYILTGEPPGARAAWSATYNRFLATVQERFSDDPLLSIFQELPEDPSYGALLTAVRQLQAYLEERIRESGGEQAPSMNAAHSTILQRMADLAREMGRMERSLASAEADTKGEDLSTRLADLRAHMEGLEGRIAELLREEE